MHGARVLLGGALLTALLATTGCGDAAELISSSIFTQAAQGPGSRVRIADVMPFAFDSMWIFPAEASPQEIRDALGPAAEELPEQRLATRGDSALLVFVRRSRVVIAVPHPPSRGRFHEETLARGIPSDSAVFVVDSASAPGRPILRRERAGGR